VCQDKHEYYEIFERWAWDWSADKILVRRKWRWGLAVTEEYEPITNWAAMQGLWEFPSPGHAVYVSRQPQHQIMPPAFGICISNVRFSEGDVKVTVRLPKTDSNVAGDGEGRILLGYRSVYDPYIMVGLGGWGFAYTIGQFDRVQGWRAIAFAGSQRNLLGDHPYKIWVRVRGQRIILKVDGIRVLDHVLESPLPQGQLGLFTWGENKIYFREASVHTTLGTVFVVMKFSDPYQELYTDVIQPIAEHYKLRAYHAGEVFGPGIILEDIIGGIVESRIVIVEITPTTQNENVFYELGYAHALKKSTILLAERGKTLPFDISGYRCLFYDNSIGGKREIEEGLRKHLHAIIQG
jgi:hypothetical protein